MEVTPRSARSSASLGIPSTRPIRDSVVPPTLERRASFEVIRETELVVPVSRESIEPRKRSELLCRATNVVIASVALVLLAPLMALVALAVRLTSPGPVIYAQTRIGIDRRRRRVHDIDVFDRRMHNLGGDVFRIYKFRTMRVDAERGSGARWATKNDSRVTLLGRLLRKTRLDELPQLFNVILGDMNIVGPRPERPSIVAKLSETIREYPLRHRTKPGITGWAQINQSYDTCMDDVREKVRYDLEYLERRGMALDLAIMLRTVPTMLFRRGGW